VKSASSRALSHAGRSAGLAGGDVAGAAADSTEVATGVVAPLSPAACAVTDKGPIQRAQISVNLQRNIAPVYREGDRDCNQGRRERNGCRVAGARVHIANSRLAQRWPCRRLLACALAASKVQAGDGQAAQS